MSTRMLELPVPPGGILYVLWAGLPLLTLLLPPPAAGAGPGWVLLPGLAVAIWALVLAARPEQTLPLAARRSAVLVLSLLGVRYLVWRCSSSLNLASAAGTSLSLLMLAAETALLATGFLQLWLTWARQPPVAAEAAAAAAGLARRLGQEPRLVPSVDVLVPTYGEPAELIERCLRGCQAIDYPRHQVWLLDDSSRPELARLCRRLGCRYLSRRQRDHAKAGNLNHALPQLSGELLLVFDADVVPRTTFLKRTVGLFSDPAVGFVQTPQSYMTADPVMRNLRLERWLMPDEETFYRWIEPTRQAVGAVVCAGTSFLMRRSALDRVGGFEIGTASEDLATGIRLAAAGYRNLYLNEKLSAGLAPLTIAAMARQRSRWASGTLQTLRTGANPLRIPGLSPLQRIAYLEGILHWFNVLPQLLLLLMPLSLGLLGVTPILVRGSGLIAVALPFYLGQLLLVRWFSRGARSALLPELYRWIFLFPILTAVIATVAGRPQRFRVTPKAIATGGASGPDRRLWIPLLVLLGLQLLNLVLLVVGAGRSELALPGASAPALDLPTQALSLTWAGLAVASLLVALRLCRDRPQADAVPWFSVGGAAVELGTPRGSRPAQVLAISESGVELRLVAVPRSDRRGQGGAEDPAASAPGACWLLWPAQLGSGLPLQIARLEQDRLGPKIGAHWQGLDERQSDALHHLLYRRPGLWPTRQAPFEPLALAGVIGRLLSRIPPQHWFKRSLLAQDLRA